MSRFVPLKQYGGLNFAYDKRTGFYVARIPAASVLDKATAYSVMFDGKQYNYDAPQNGALGNAYLYNRRFKDTGEPFYFAPAMGMVISDQSGIKGLSYGILKDDEVGEDDLAKKVEQLSEEIENIKENGGGSGGVSPQLVTIAPEFTVDVEHFANAYVVKGMVGDIVVGKRYVVTVDGAEHEVYGSQVENNGIMFPAISVEGVFTVTSKFGTTAINIPEIGEHTVEIKAEEIPPNILPGVVKPSSFGVHVEEASGSTRDNRIFTLVDTTWMEIFIALMENKRVSLRAPIYTSYNSIVVGEFVFAGVYSDQTLMFSCDYPIGDGVFYHDCIAINPDNSVIGKSFTGSNG